MNRVSDTTMIVFWNRLTLVEAQGFVTYRIKFSPRRSRKRQEQRLDVNGTEGSAIIDNLLSGIAYDVTVGAFNTLPNGIELPGSTSTVIAPGGFALIHTLVLDIILLLYIPGSYRW